MNREEAIKVILERRRQRILDAKREELLKKHADDKKSFYEEYNKIAEEIKNSTLEEDISQKEMFDELGIQDPDDAGIFE